jgi:hypothetical protein
MGRKHSIEGLERKSKVSEWKASSSAVQSGSKM